MFTIYGKNECPMCFKIKTVLELLGKEYVYKELNIDYTEEEFETKFPNTCLYHKWSWMVRIWVMLTKP